MRSLVALVVVALAVAACADDDAAPDGIATTSGETSTSTSIIEIDPVVIAPATPGEGFPDGTWSGVIAQDTAFLTVPGDPGALVTSSDFYGTFLITVEDGFVTGSYVITANQVLESGADGAQGSTVITGIMEGSSAGPAMVAQVFGFDGTITMDGVTSPFQFEQAMEAIAAPADWTFDVISPDYVAGQVSAEGLVAATEATSGVSFSTVTSVFAAAPGEEADLDMLIAVLREGAGIEG